MKKYFILLFLITGISIGLSAKEMVKGVVQDAYNNPLVGANLIWEGSGNGTSTDIDGNFELAKPAGKRNLIVSYIGYITDTLEITTDSDHLQIILHDNTKLEEVVVRGKGMGTLQSVIEPLQVQKIGTAEFQRAACCNLSEAFETNASVDVSYADAATGAKQIKMLGLSNEYVQLMTENNPTFRGAVSRYGMDYIPGPWMESIQISKGASSVKNGYEAVAGQINVEYKKPYASDPLTINLFGSDNGRLEGNVDGNIRINENLSTGIFAHYSNDKKAHDANKDGFLDRPKLEQINLMNRWNYRKGNLHSDFGIRYINDKRESGQSQHLKDNHNADLYQVSLITNRLEFFSKNGYILDADKNQSIALILSGSGHDLNSKYGLNAYQLRQNNLYANLIFETDLGIRHQLSSGVSMTLDQLDQKLSLTKPIEGISPERNEFVFGGYAQYTYKPLSNLTILAGIRADHHNEYGAFITP
ncbi:MAG: TonB-dependent receptor, partial [Bacteroidales bacterium]